MPDIQQEDLRAQVPPTIFFMTLNSFALVRLLMLKGDRIPLSTPVQTAAGALILGNAVLIAAMLRFINRYPGKPLVAWKTTIRSGRHVAPLLRMPHRFWRETGAFVAGNQKLLAEIV